MLCIFVAGSPPCCNNCSIRIFNCRASLWRSTRSTFWGSRSWCTCNPEEGVGGGRDSFEKWCAIHAHHLKIPSSPRSVGRRGPCSAPFWKPSSPIRGRLSASATLMMRMSSWTWFLNFGYSSSWINIMKIDQAPLFTLPSPFPFKTRYFLLSILFNCLYFFSRTIFVKLTLFWWKNEFLDSLIQKMKKIAWIKTFQYVSYFFLRDNFFCINFLLDFS